MDPQMKMRMKIRNNTRINMWEEGERITEEEEAKEEVAKEETTITIIVIIEVIIDGEDFEKTARRYNLGKQIDPKNLLQAAKGAR